MRCFVTVQTCNNFASISTIGDDAMVCGQQLGERRLAMSRRHYIAAGGEVIPEGCVFLAPLVIGTAAWTSDFTPPAEEYSV